MTITTVSPTRRGTSNTNSRGSAEDRRRRRIFLLDTFGNGITAPCAFCGMELQNTDPNAADYLTVDRILPGAHGGRYVRQNIRPACAADNSEDGGKIAAGMRLAIVTQNTTVTV